MYKALKIELKLTNEQKIQVNKTIGVERFIYNEYIKYNQEQYQLNRHDFTDKDVEEQD
ncbi:helix-turn-helix domain-containing protein [Fusobacterium polymorphum]|uniref:helix-turn-helix domain-containing protein n=1 Tax=Fusobacterium nucleatum subsp. polymorphum TaxID=76857 RepID=UPI000B2EF239|nr:helix-turn-helix domain-containing protein [Fusobacterium polymorphum]